MKLLQKLKKIWNTPTNEFRLRKPKEPFTLSLPSSRPEKDTIGLFNKAIIIRIERELTPEFNYNYHDSDGQILADKIKVVTTKGTFQIKSCNECDVLYFREGA